MKLVKIALIGAAVLTSVFAFADLRVRENVRACRGDVDCILRVLTDSTDKIDDYVARRVDPRISALEDRVRALETRHGGGDI